MADRSDWDFNELTVLAESFAGVKGRLNPAIAQTMKGAGEQVAERARDLAPKGATGRMSRSIRSDVIDTGTDVTVEVGPTVYYGRFLEHGTSKMSAQPFLGPAADSLTAQIVDQLADAAGKVLE